MTPKQEESLLTSLNSIDSSLRELVKAVHAVAAAGAGGGGGAASGPSTAVVPFGKNKGKALGDLSDRQLSFYAFVWTPQTSEQYPNPSPRDRALKAAAEAEAKRRGLEPEGGEPESSTIEVRKQEEPENGQAFPTDGSVDETEVPF